MLFVYTGQDRYSRGKHCHEYYEYVDREPSVIEADSLEEAEELIMDLDVYNYKIYAVSSYPILDKS